MLKVVNTIGHLLIHSALLCSVSPFLVVGLTVSANIKDIKVSPNDLLLQYQPESICPNSIELFFNQ